MRQMTVSHAASHVILFLALAASAAACSAPVPGASETAAATAPPKFSATHDTTASPVPVFTPVAPAPTPAPMPAPTPPPTPTPMPPALTPAPDPWAGKFFTAGGAYVSVKDADNGPWVYKDANLSIQIMREGGSGKYRYYIAEIYSRGPVPIGGFAYESDRGRTELPYKIARRYDAVFGINADYFNKKSNGKGVIIREGVVYANRKNNSTLAILPDGSLKAFEPGAIDADRLKRMGVQDSFSFGPILVKDGAMDSASMKKHWLPRNAREYRTGIGQVEPGHYIAIVTDGYFTMPQFAQLFIDSHCSMAYNMDGGHSACMLFMGEQLNRLNISGIIKNLRQRPLPDLLLLGENAAVPDLTAAVYCDGVKRYAKNRPQPTQGVIK